MPQDTVEHRSRRPSWNSYLTDDDKFKLSKQELLQKKKLLISKHNILTSGSNSSPVKSKVRRVKKTSTKADSASKIGKTAEKHQSRVSSGGPTSLDLLDCEDLSSDDDSKDSFCSPVKAVTSVKAVRRKDPLTVGTAGSNGRVARHNRRPARTGSSHHPTTLSTTQNQPSTAKHDMGMSNQDMVDISSLISTLNTELRFFEQISGRRSALDAEELAMTLTSGVDGRSGGPLQPVSVLRYLVQLVCQTMSYLLQSEIDKQKQQDKYDALEQRLDKLTALMHNGPSTTSTPVKPHTYPQDFAPLPKSPPTHHGGVETPVSQRPPQTPDTGRTTDLYGPPSSPFPESPGRAPSPQDFAVATPDLSARPPSAASTGRGEGERDGGRPHVSFRLPDSESSAASPQDGRAETPMRGGGQLGSSASDWLFAPAATLAASFGTYTSAGHANGNGTDISGYMQPRSQDAAPSAASPSSSAESTPVPLHNSPSTPGSARVLELQRQLAILRHERSSAAKDSSPSAPNTDPLRQWMRWNDDMPLSTPPGTGPSVHVPAVPYEVSSLVSYADEGDEHNRDRPAYSSRNQMTHLTRLSVGEDEGEEGVSCSAIPSHLVPTPERAPRHPFNGTSGSGSTAAGGVPSFVRGYSYDARSGSYGS